MVDNYIFQFTSDWFSNNIGALKHYLEPLRKVPNLKMLEIGSWEGRSTIWFLQYFKDLEMTCVDTFEGGIEHQTMSNLKDIWNRFCHNIEPFKEQVKVLKGNSKTELFKLSPSSFDLIYVDGSHEAPDALFDIVTSFQLLKSGGIMMIDDYANNVVISEDEYLQHAQPAVNAFLDLYRQQILVIHKAYQVYLVKK